VCLALNARQAKENVARITKLLWLTFHLSQRFFLLCYSYSAERMLPIKTICFLFLLTAVMLEAAPKGISLNSLFLRRDLVPKQT